MLHVLPFVRTDTIRVVKDGKYGAENPTDGGWDGMVGELVRRVSFNRAFASEATFFLFSRVHSRHTKHLIEI